MVNRYVTQNIVTFICSFKQNANIIFILHFNIARNDKEIRCIILHHSRTTFDQTTVDRLNCSQSLVQTPSVDRVEAISDHSRLLDRFVRFGYSALI